MMALKVTDPDVDAERSYTLADYYPVAPAGDRRWWRRWKRGFARAVEPLDGVGAFRRREFLLGAARSRPRGELLQARRGPISHLSGDAANAQWRVAWTAVLKRAPEGAELLQQHLRLFPGSTYTPDALYWLGRLAEDAGVPGLARSYYDKLIERFPQNYFETLAVKRVRALDPAPKQIADVLATIPPLPVAQKMGDAIPAAAANRKARADALKSIAFDASAELELRAA